MTNANPLGFLVRLSMGKSISDKGPVKIVRIVKILLKACVIKGAYVFETYRV